MCLRAQQQVDTADIHSISTNDPTDRGSMCSTAHADMSAFSKSLRLSHNNPRLLHAFKI